MKEEKVRDKSKKLKRKFEPIDLSGVRTYPLGERPSKVSLACFAAPPHAGASFGSFLRGLPEILVGAEFRSFIRELSAAIRAKKTVIVGIGGHVIKCGLSPVLIDLMRRGWISALAMNGATAIHDVEIAICGSTSEDVAVGMEDGSFGMAEETGEFINGAIRNVQEGYGAALGRRIVEADLPHMAQSVLGAAFELGLPATVHVAVGTDIVHQHPSADGESIGRTSFEDFRLFCAVVASLQGGAYLNVGSAVLLPEVFLKALTVARNLGHKVTDFITANFDMIQHYRPVVNVVQRPNLGGGRGYTFTGHHELLIPFLAQALHDALEDRAEAAGHKIISLADARAVRERLKSIGETVVFTNGCFDLLHRGHVTYMQKARSLGDALILGLNSDDSVRRIKGAGRPVLPLEDRACVLAGLEAVDYICVFEEDTPRDLIQALLPDVLVKGGDYRLDEIVGGEEVEAAGGRVRTVPLVEGHSTTDVIQRILQAGGGRPDGPDAARADSLRVWRQAGTRYRRPDARPLSLGPRRSHLSGGPGARGRD